MRYTLTILNALASPPPVGASVVFDLFQIPVEVRFSTHVRRSLPYVIVSQNFTDI